MDPSVDDVRLQLDRVLASPGFANADRMSGFLRYVVERSLAGEADQVKEYAIGIDVFARNQDYDPRLDSIVRVEARRLRTKVDEYYAGEGQADPVLIRLRRGSYVPVFERRDTAPASSVMPPPAHASPFSGRSFVWRIGLGLVVVALLGTIAARRGGLWATSGGPEPSIRIAVLPFWQYSSDPSDKLLAARLTDGVTSQLARIGKLSVVSHTSALQFAEGSRRPTADVVQRLKADYLIEGTVTRTGDYVGVNVRLVSADQDRKIWVKDFVGSAADPGELERRIAAAITPEGIERRR